MEREKGRAKGFSDNVTGEKQAKALRAAFPSAIQAKCDRLLSIKRRNTVVPLRFRLFFDSTPRRDGEFTDENRLLSGGEGIFERDCSMNFRE